jgi:HEAT repeat protein
MSAKNKPFWRMLQGGDRRSIGASNQVVRQTLQNPRRMRELVECLWSDDALVRMRAADAIEKVSVPHPDLIQRFKAELLGLSRETGQPEIRWHMALILPRLHLSRTEIERARATLRSYLQDQSSIVKTCTLQGLMELSEGDAQAQAETVELLEICCRTGTPAMKARSRKLLKGFRKQ